MLRDLKEGGYNFQNKSLDFIFDLLIIYMYILFYYFI